MKHAAIYCRISDDPSGLAEGTDAQERQGREYVSELRPDLPIIVYTDDDLTAADDSVYRERFEALREALARREVAFLWTVEQTRLCRTYRWFSFAEELLAAGITEVHTRRDGIIEVGELAADVGAVVAIHEVKKMKKRLRDKQDDKAARGGPPGGRRFGYRSVTDEYGRKGLEVVPEQAEIIRDVAGRLLAGESKTRIARELAAAGVVGAKGGPITAARITSWFQGAAIAGLRLHRGELLRDKATGELVRGQWEPILDVAKWQAVRAKLNANTGKGKGKGERPGRRKYLLSGIAWCPSCERTMVGSMVRRSGRNDSARYICTSCHVTISAEAVENHVTATLLDRLDYLAGRLAFDQHAERRAEIVTELDAVEARRKMLRRMLTRGDVTEEEWPEMKADLDQQEAALTRRLAELPAPVNTIDVDAVRRSWEHNTEDERRTICSLLIEKVVISPAQPGASRRTVDLDRVAITGPGWEDEAVAA